MDKPALEGGRPQRKYYLPYGQHRLTVADIRRAETVLRSKWITQGPVIDQFEGSFARMIGCRYAIALNSGTAALHTAVASLGLEPGDEVITTPLTFIATVNSILYVGAKPVLADINPGTLNLDQGEVAKLISPKTKAIIFVHFAGNPTGFKNILQLSKDSGLALIDDASHALGARSDGKMIGSFKESVTVFSFHPVKHITTGEGGMIVTANERTAAFARVFRNHGIDREARARHGAAAPWSYDIKSLGWNYRLTDIGAAIGLSQLERLEAGLTKRAKIAQFYSKRFADLPQIEIPSQEGNVRHAWHLYPVLINERELKVDRDRFIQLLRAENIGAAVHYPPAHLFSFHLSRLGYKQGDFPNAEDASRHIVSLPIFPAMSKADCEDVTHGVRKIVRFYAR